MRLSNVSAPADKIALFRSLFRGRQEVWPRRFESVKTGRAGYSPVCGNEWLKGVCEKPRIKCADCPHQRWLPVTDEVIRQHLSGADEHGRPCVAGVYPMLLDEHCWFLAVDFDGGEWSADVRGYVETCERLGVPASLERSRSGNGGHVWIFFAEAVPAALARKLGAHVLTETMEQRPEVGLKSYDRFFPNQDTLPRGGFGNLIALPLQKAAREQGNSVFVDERLEPHADQWAYLAGVRRMDRSEVERIVREAEGRGRIVGVRMAAPEEEAGEPWTLNPSRQRLVLPRGELPAVLKLVLADQVYVPKAGLPPALRNALFRLAAFQNPEFYRAQAMRLPTHDKPRIISCAEEHAEHIGLPRGCLDEILALLKTLKVRADLSDQRFGGRAIDLSFTGELTPEQAKAGAAMLAHDFGVLSATTAFGKTVVGAWLMAQRGVNTLVLVHREQLMRQWVERLAQFLNLDTADIGRWGGGRKKLGGRVDVALIQSVVRQGVVHDLVADYGHVMVDECHHLSAHSFELVVRRAKARFVTGLSATVTRKDGHHPIIWMQCGPVRHRVDARQQAAARPFTHEVVVRPTGFFPEGTPEADSRREFQRLCDAVMRSTTRNALIVAEVAEAVRTGRSPVVLTERTEHLDLLVAGVRAAGVPHVIALRGGLGRKALAAVLEQLKTVPAGEGRVLVATGRFLGEGFDDARLDTLFLTMPVSWRGTIAQYAGRLHRLHAGKTVVQVHDYVDLDVPMLSRMFDKRCLGYEAVGYTILVPASALPGWPQDVPLPVDAQWKADYAASVRRLIRDGVETPLAQLFVRAARRVEPGAEGAARARSASEAFIFHRFETIPELRGKFRLNIRLPIPFDDTSRMEVDLLCEEMKIAVEIDGGQHLADADAWRRDRRKDVLLQSHGYLVLRFLAEDLGRRLDMVIDTVLRALATRGGR
jgi:superfamily II DNA or RNA helicase/very-short-patch-repair endonuclease